MIFCKNVNCEYDCNGLFYVPPRPPTPTSALTFYFNGIDIGLCKNDILGCIFDIVYGEYCFDIGENIIVNDMNNENFCNNGYYGYYYPTPSTTPTPRATVFYFNGIGIGIPGIDILKSVFGIDYNEYVFDHEINNNNGM